MNPVTVGHTQVSGPQFLHEGYYCLPFLPGRALGRSFWDRRAPHGISEWEECERKGSVEEQGSEEGMETYSPKARNPWGQVKWKSSL